MRVTTRFAALALWASCLAPHSSHADDSPWVHLEGYRCEAVTYGEASPNSGSATTVFCQIEDSPDPTSARRLLSAMPTTTTPTLDSLLHLLSTLNHTLHDPSLLQHDNDTTSPPPAP